MSCGCAVIVSDSSCLPEIVGGSGILFPAGDDMKLAESIRRVLDDKHFAEDARKEGIVRASGFNDRAFVEGVLRAYRKAMKK